MEEETTIAAIATPKGMGGISIIRVSGEKSVAIVSKFFRGRNRLEKAGAWKVNYGKFIVEQENTRSTIDQVMITVFKKPRSYTGEDVVEISCHGGQLVTGSILNALLSGGAELAKPGEFTLRAFLNGRIDLAQAEAVSDTIRARSQLSLKSSIEQLEGSLSKRIKKIQNVIISAVSLLELELDFSEEDVEFVERINLQKKIVEIQHTLEQLISSYKRGKAIKEGIRTVIVGKPNVGKSSLLNAMVMEDRAIVTDLPGTTRDVLEEAIEIQGKLFRIYDTAGIIESKNLVEQEGIYRSHKMINKADIILAVFDASNTPDKWDLALVELLKEKASQKRIVAILNKIDIRNSQADFTVLDEKLNQKLIELSAKKVWGFDVLERELVAASNSETASSSDEIILTNIRHKRVLEKALKSLNHALQSIEEKLSSELIVIDLRATLDSLGEIIGITTSEDILNEIFSKFCIGK